MKKNLKKILGILLLLTLFIPCFVKADMGAPMFTQYEVRITNPNGTMALDIDGKEVETIKYDEIIKVVYEKIIENELYVGDYNKLVKFSDTKLVTEDVDLEKFKQGRKQKYYVFDNTNVLYKGPSKTYGKVEPETTLKEGSIVETQYYDQLWAYVEQDGVKGWVYKYTYNFEAPYEEKTGMALSMENYYDRKDNTRKTLNEIKIYKNPKEKEVVTTIPKDTDFEIIYFYADEPRFPYYYISYNGQEGWIKSEKIEIEGYSFYNMLEHPSYKYIVNNVNGALMYKEYNSTSEVLETIPKNTELDIKYGLMGHYNFSWYQVEYNGKIGWVKSENDNNTEELPEEQPETDMPNAEEETNSEETQTENFTPTEEKEISPKQMIIICITTAIVVGLTAFITIKLVNKKKESQI